MGYARGGLNPPVVDTFAERPTDSPEFLLIVMGEADEALKQLCTLVLENLA